MSLNARKLIGMVALVLLVIFYAILATTIAEARLSDASNFAKFAYFFLTGILWVVPAMFIIKWMIKP
ncbi:MAG: DUF2842 domain-containing protein [Nitratireductor sp.]